MGFMKDYFVDQGLTLADIPKAIIIHEVISIALAAGWWAACYHVQPTKLLARSTIASRQLPKRLAWSQELYQKGLVKAQQKIDKWQWLKRLPGADPPRLASSMAESFVVRAALKPVSFGGKLWLSWKLTLMTKGHRPKLLPPSDPPPASPDGPSGKQTK